MMFATHNLGNCLSNMIKDRQKCTNDSVRQGKCSQQNTCVYGEAVLPISSHLWNFAVHPWLFLSSCDSCLSRLWNLEHHWTNMPFQERPLVKFALWISRLHVHKKACWVQEWVGNNHFVWFFVASYLWLWICICVSNLNVLLDSISIKMFYVNKILYTQRQNVDHHNFSCKRNRQLKNIVCMQAQRKARQRRSPIYCLAQPCT